MLFVVRTFFCRAVLFLICLASVAQRLSQAVEPSFEYKRQASTSVHWQHVELRDGLTRLADVHSVTIFLDRRVDPSTPISISAQNIPLDRLLEEIVTSKGYRVTNLDHMFYIGPHKITKRMRTLCAKRKEETTQLPDPLRKALRKSKAIVWPSYSTPKFIIEKECTARGIKFIGLDKLPHDLWAAGQLPAAPFAEQLSVLLAGFDLQWQPTDDKKALRYIPVTGTETLTRSYTIAASRSTAAGAIQEIKKIAPNAKIHESDKKLTVTFQGLLEEHEQVAQILGKRKPKRKPRSQSNTPVANSEKRYTLRLQEKPAGPVMKQLLKQLGLKVQMDEKKLEKAGVKLNKPISFSVNKATLEELLKTMTSAAGCRYELSGNNITILPPK